MSTNGKTLIFRAAKLKGFVVFCDENNNWIQHGRFATGHQVRLCNLTLQKRSFVQAPQISESATKTRKNGPENSVCLGLHFCTDEEMVITL